MDDFINKVVFYALFERHPLFFVVILEYFCVFFEESFILLEGNYQKYSFCEEYLRNMADYLALLVH